MRDIKFRFWDSKNKTMWLPEDISMVMIENLKVIPIFDSGYEYRQVEDLNNITAMQYVGIRDITGKEIYEGDIVESTYKLNVLLKSPVFYSENSQLNPMNTIYNYDGDCYKVIGNIYENPELLDF